MHSREATMPAKFSAPKEWQDWLNIAFGIWLWVSAFILGFGDETVAVRNAAVVGLLLILAEVFTFSAVALVEIVIDLLLGVWLISSPWILTMASRNAVYDFTITGVLVVALACCEFWQGYRKTPRA
jgi:hypothetical protein